MISNTNFDSQLYTTKDIRFSNRRSVLHHLILKGSSTRQELSQVTGLSIGTIANLISDLIEEGLVVENGVEASQGGRPTSITALNGKAGACVGIDVAETYIHFELFDLGLKHLADFEVPLSPEQNHPEQIVRQIWNGLNILLAQAHIDMEDVVGAGISIPGPFDHSTGVSVFAPNWGWRDVALKPMLEQQIPVHLYLDNPLKFNTIAEAWFGGGRNINNLATIVLGTGVGAGLVINGQLVQGASNTSGEWGHTTIIHEGRLCRCGNHGCIEAYIGAPGIVQTMREIDPASPLIDPEDQAETIGNIVTAANNNDRFALAVLQKTSDILGEGLANLINLINPELIILGSWVARQIGPSILPNLKVAIEHHALAQSYRAANITLSSLPDDAVSLGAAVLVLEDFLANAGKTAIPSRSRERPHLATP